MVKGSLSVANSDAQRALIAHWQGIVKSLGNFLDTLKANHVSIFFFDFIHISLPLDICYICIMEHKLSCIFPAGPCDFKLHEPLLC